MSLLDEPVKWAEAAVGKRYMFFILIGLHIALGFWAIWVTRKNGIDSMTFGILYFGVAHPCMYLYALKAVLTKYRMLSAEN